jgi:hypothetical protein
MKFVAVLLAALSLASAFAPATFQARQSTELNALFDAVRIAFRWITTERRTFDFEGRPSFVRDTVLLLTCAFSMFTGKSDRFNLKRIIRLPFFI